MKDISESIQKALIPELGEGFDFDIIPVKDPSQLDMAGKDFDFTFVIQAREKRKRQIHSAAAVPAAVVPTQSTRSNLDGIYSDDGRPNIEYLLHNASVLRDAGEYPLAHNIYQTLIKSGASTDRVLFEMALCYDKEEKKEDAKRNYEEAIAYCPTKRYYLALGDFLRRQEDYREAASVLERAAHLKNLTAGEHLKIQERIGQCMAKAGDIDKAEAHFLKALEIDEQADSICVALGALFLKNKDTKKAKRHYNDAIAMNPKNAKAYLGLGCCQMVDRNVPAAHENFINSLKINLHDSSAIYYLVKTAYELKRYKEAASLVARYVEEAPISVSLLYSLAGLQYHIGNYDQAIKTCKKIFEIKKDHSGSKKLLDLIDRKSNKNLSRRTDVSKSDSTAGKDS